MIVEIKMNTIQNLQSYIGKIDDAVCNVDLVKVGQTHEQHFAGKRLNKKIINK